MEVPPNETPEAITSLFDGALSLLAAYGWKILFFIIVANLSWSHFQPKYRKWRERLEDEKQEKEYRENPELILAREEALAKSRQKLQEEHNKKTREYAEKLKEQEERKRQEKIENWERLQEGSSQRKPIENRPQTLRGDHNPLMGYGEGGSFRPGRRGGAGGGG